jgi:hypothetical protein
MPTRSHRTTPTVFEVVERAVEICDPAGHDPALAELLRRFEDRDEPVTALGRRRTREFFEVAWTIMGEQPDLALVMAAAVATYLAYRRDELDDDPRDILRLAARAEFGRHVPDDVVEWLAARGVRVRPAD